MNKGEETSSNFGAVFIIIVITIFIFLICGFFLFISTSKDDNYTNEEEKRVETKEVKEDKNNIKRILSSLDYNKINNNISESLIDIKDNKINMLIYKEIQTKLNNEELLWYGKFGILNDTKIVNEEGKVLLTSNNIKFYPNTKLWSINNIVYDTEGEIFNNKDTHVLDDNCNYLIDLSKGTRIINNKKRLIYENKDEKYKSHKTSTYNNQDYLLLNYDKKSIIIDLKDGSTILESKEPISYQDNNLFFSNNKYLFIYDSKVALEIDKEIKNYELSNKYVAINNDVYKLSDMSIINNNVYIPNKEEDKIEREYNLEKISCRMGYGLYYNNEELLPCEYKNIRYFTYNINKVLTSSNKYYVIITDNDMDYIYDIKNKKKVVESPKILETGLITEIYDINDSYFYNILTSTKTNNKAVETILYSKSNYYVLSNEDNSYYKYYDNKFNKIYEIK